MTEKTYKISGMHCAACSAGIERFLSRQEAIESVAVNLATERMLVSFDESRISSEDIIALVQKMMYGCEEYISSGELCLIEWPERIEPLLPEDTMVIKIEILSDTERRFIIK